LPLKKIQIIDFSIDTRYTYSYTLSMDANTFSVISISIPMVIGFVGLFFSVLSSSSSSNHRIADLRIDVDRRFDEQKAYMNQRFDDVDRRFTDVNKRLDEQKSEISLVSKRLNTYLDSYAVRIMTESKARVSRKKTVAKAT
jgi:hypothetical protein